MDTKENSVNQRVSAQSAFLVAFAGIRTVQTVPLRVVIIPPMRTRFAVWVLLFGVALSFWGTAVPSLRGRAAPSPREEAAFAATTLSEGVYFQEFHLPVGGRPVDFFVVRMQRGLPHLTLDVAIADGALAHGRDTVAGMAQAAEGALSTWGERPWGRNHVLAAVNGYYFDLESGTPWRGVVQSGWYAQRFDDVESGSGFVWTRDGRAFVGGCLYHPAGKQTVTWLASGKTLRFQGVNRPRGKDELVLYTSHYDADTGTSDEGLEVLVELNAPLGIAPAGSDKLVTGVVRAVRDHAGSTPLPYGYVVLSASGKARRQLLKSVAAGDAVGIHQEIAHFAPDCQNPSPNDWGNAYAAIGGDYVLLRNRETTDDVLKPEAQRRNARTAIAYNDAFVFFVVADGWNPGVSEGVTALQLARFVRDVLGATDAVTEDSGGSATMWVNGKVVNNTYCNFTHNCGPEGEPGADGVYPVLQPLVGTAVLMVDVKPGERSDTFARGDSITTRRPARLYQGPGRLYAPVETIPGGRGGLILPTLLELGGIRAEDAYWWRARFGEAEGWIEEAALWGGATPPRRVETSRSGGSGFSLFH